MDESRRKVNALSLAYRLLDELYDDDNTDHEIGSPFIDMAKLDRLIELCEWRRDDE